MHYRQALLQAWLLIGGILSAHALDYSGLNIDFGAPDAAPDTSYAAAGNAGYWNVVDSLGATPRGGFYDDIEQGPAWLEHVTLSSDVRLFDSKHGAESFPAEDAALLGDYIYSSGNTVGLKVEGLPEGLYSLIVYFMGGAEAQVTVGNSEQLFHTRTVTGDWDGAYEQGVTHEAYSVQVGADGVLLISFYEYGDALINGMQLVSPVVSEPPVVVPPSDYLDEAGWAWIVTGDAWSWPVPAEDEAGGVGISGTLSRYQTSTLSTEVAGPTHLRFFWGGDLPYSGRLSLRINGVDYVTFNGGEQFEGHFQVYLPEVNNEVSWQVRNALSRELDDFVFYLDSVETVGGATNHPPSIIESAPSFTAGVDSVQWMECEDLDGDTPVFRVINKDYDNPNSSALPPGISFTNNWDGRATLTASSPRLSGVGLHPLFVSVQDGGGWVSRELLLEVQNPFAVGTIQRSEAMSLVELFGVDAAGCELIHCHGDLALLKKTEAGSLIEYVLGAGGSWGLGAVLAPPSLDGENYEFLDTISVDADRFAILAETSNDALRHILVYQRNELGTLTFESAIQIPGEFESRSGNLDLGDEWLVATNPYFSNPDGSSGRLFIYEIGLEGQWELSAELIVPNISTGVDSLDIYNDTLALGGGFEWDEDTFEGAEVVHVFANDSVEGWMPMETIYANVASSGFSIFGNHLGFQDGQLFIAQGEDPEGGSVQIYDLKPDGTLELRQVLREVTAKGFGRSFALGGQTLIVADGCSSLHAEFGGTAYRYAKADSGDWQRTNVLAPEVPQFDGAFGEAVYSSNAGDYVVDGSGALYRFVNQTFEEWYQSTTGHVIGSWQEAVAGDENDNGVADGIDYLKLNQEGTNTFLEAGNYEVGANTYRGVRFPHIETNGLSWEVEYSSDLREWSSAGVRLFEYGSTQTWGLPEEDAGTNGFFRINVSASVQ